MKNVLVTGGAGYIGSHVVEALIKRGFKVFIVDNLSTGYKKLINKKAKFYNLDVNNFKKVKKKLIENNVDSVIHLAASLDVNESEKYPKKYFHNNVNGTLNLIKSIRNSKVKNFLFSSTAAVYKDGIFKVKENSETKPKSIYGKTKLKSEKIIKRNLKKKKVNYAILRFFNVCGASSTNRIGQIKSYDLLFKNLASAILKKKPSINIYGNSYKTKDGTCIRDFIHVSDISDIHLKVLLKINKIKKSLVLNCGYGKGRSVLEVVKGFEKYSKKKIKINFKPKRKADLSQIISNNNKLKKFLKWRAKNNSLPVMIKSCIKWEKKINETNR